MINRKCSVILSTSLLGLLNFNSVLATPIPMAGYKFDGNCQDSAGFLHAVPNDNICYHSDAPKGGGKASLQASGTPVIVRDIVLPVKAFTYSFWFKPVAKIDSTAARQEFIYGLGQYETSRRPHITFNRESDGRIGFYGSDKNGEFELMTKTNSFSDDWHNIIFLFDGAEHHVFFDGKLEDSLRRSGDNKAATGISIAAADTGSHAFKGLFDEFAIFDEALSFEVDKNNNLKGGELAILYEKGIYRMIPADYKHSLEMVSRDEVNKQCMPVLMPDDFESLHHVGWRVEKAQPDSRNPLLLGEMPWDAGGILTHGTVLLDPIDSKWKAWIVTTPVDRGVFDDADPAQRLEGDPLRTTNDRHRRICYYESKDGIRWTAPELENVSYGDYKKTNIIFDIEGDWYLSAGQYANVFVDPENKEYPYEMIIIRKIPGKERSYYKYLSKDGKRWEHETVLPMPTSIGDVAYFYKLNNGQYAGYSKNGLIGKGRSIFQFRRQEDRWSSPVVTLTQGVRDHDRTQYMELVPLKVPGGYVAVVTMFWEATQTLDFRLAVSRDGLHWWQPDIRPILDNASLGDFGGGMLWQSKDLIVKEDQVFIYYAATEAIHQPVWDTRAEDFLYEDSVNKVVRRPRGFYPFNGGLCRAQMRIDRLYALASAAGGAFTGAAITTSRELNGKSLFVNYRCKDAEKNAVGFREGVLVAEILDKDGNPIEGYKRSECRALTGDSSRKQITWKGGDKMPANGAKIKFYLTRAFLYGFECK